MFNKRQEQSRRHSLNQPTYGNYHCYTQAHLEYGGWGRQARCHSHPFSQGEYRCNSQRGQRHHRQGKPKCFYVHSQPRGYDDVMHASGFGRNHGQGGHGGRGRSGGRNFPPTHVQRRIGADDLQLIVLALLEEKPRHGYEIIKHLDTFTQGFYAPSPGMIYPVLTYLEESELVSMSMQGNKKSYELTETGLAHLNKNRDHVQALMTRLVQAGEHMYRMQQSYAQEIDESLSSDVLHEAIRSLRTVLRDKRTATDTEKERVSAILTRALKEITG